MSADAEISLGYLAGTVTQGIKSVAVGNKAGKTTQGTMSVAVGNSAGESDQKAYSVAVGNSAGKTTQGTNSVAVGNEAGKTDLGDNSIAIGNKASQAGGDHASTIVLNATGVALDPAGPTGTYISPIATGLATNILYYNDTSKQVTKGAVPGGMEYHHWGIDYVVYTAAASNSGFFGKPIGGVSYINYSQPTAAIGTSMSASNYDATNGHFTITTAGVYIIHIQILHAVFTGTTSGYTDVAMMEFPPSGGFDNQWSVFARGGGGYWQGANKQTRSQLHYTGYLPANFNFGITFSHIGLNQAAGPVTVNVLGENGYAHSSFIKFYKIG